MVWMRLESWWSSDAGLLVPALVLVLMLVVVVVVVVVVLVLVLVLVLMLVVVVVVVVVVVLLASVLMPMTTTVLAALSANPWPPPIQSNRSPRGLISPHAPLLPASEPRQRRARLPRHIAHPSDLLRCVRVLATTALSHQPVCHVVVSLSRHFQCTVGIGAVP